MPTRALPDAGWRRTWDTGSEAEVGELVVLPRTLGPGPSRLSSIRHAAGMSSKRFAAFMAEELGWPELPAAVLGALEEGRPEPSARVMAAAERVLARSCRANTARAAMSHDKTSA